MQDQIKIWNKRFKAIFKRNLGRLSRKIYLFLAPYCETDYHLVLDYYGRSSGKMLDIREQQPFAEYARKVIKSRRTMLYYDRLYTLYQAIENLAFDYRNQNARPNILEVGVYRGGGSYFLISVANDLIKSGANIYCVDTFGGHSEKDLNSELDPYQKLGDFISTSYQDVKDYLAEYPSVTVLQGRIQEYEQYFKNLHFDLIHLDVDIYEPTYYSLVFFTKRLSKNGVIIVDDYSFTTCPGAKVAVEQYMKEHTNTFARFELLSGQCLLVRKS